MEKWRRIWRFGLAPLISRPALFRLRTALMRDDRRLLQGCISSPIPLDASSNCAVLGACAIGFCAWQAEGLATVGEVERYFHQICDRADAALLEPAACRFFLNWYDETPRPEMRRQLLAEVNLALERAEPLAA